jgi:hypothetical protein
MNFLNHLFAVVEILVLVILVVPDVFDFVGFVVGGSGFVVGFVVLVGFVGVCNL